MKRTWLAVPTILVLVVGVRWLAEGRTPESSAALAPRSEVASPAGAKEVGEAPARRPKRVAPSAESNEREGGSRAAAPTPDSTTKLRVEGTVVVVDEAGVEHAGLDGTLELLLWRDERASEREVAVHEGEWSVEVDFEVQLGVATLTLGGREALLADDPYERFAVGAGVVALRASWHARTLLHVVDQSSGAELQGVTVLSGFHWQNNDAGHPGEQLDSKRVVDGRSPIVIEPTGFQALTKDTALLARAPGYAWGRIQVNLSVGGERELRLMPEARLEVYFTGAPAHASARLRLFDEEGGSPYLELEPKARRRIELDGLLPGAYALRVEVGEWWDQPMVQTAGEVALRSGELASVTLDIAQPPELARARLAGVVVIPAEWKLFNTRLTIQLEDTPLDGGDGRQELQLGSLPGVAGEADARRFDAGLVQLGTYELTLNEVEFSIRVELPAGGREDVRLELPPPAQVSIEVLDEGSGLPAELEHLNWHCAREGGGGLNTVRRDADTGRFDFRAPQASVIVSSWGETHQPLSETLEIGAGTNAFTLRAKPGCSVILRLLDGETPVPWEGHWYPSEDAVEGPGTVVGMSLGQGVRTLRLSEPGHYLFELPELPGFEPAAPVAVDARAGDTVEVEVPLTRKR